MFDWLAEGGFWRHAGVFYLTPHEHRAAEQAYVRAREREGRLYADAALRMLPEPPAGDPHAGEWRMRAESLARLKRHLAAGECWRSQEHVDDLRCTILDLGCGNGWMSHQLAAVPGCQVLGLDLNVVELEQAARVFSANPRLRFAYGDVFQASIPPASFDVIVLAAAVQYFAAAGLAQSPQLPDLLRHLRTLLRPGGEMHILDSPLYTSASVEAARQRTRDYYQRLGVPDMIPHYHHHLWADLEPFAPDVLFDPTHFWTRLRRRLTGRPRSPFPWLRLRRGAG